jgi:hypothetical protein
VSSTKLVAGAGTTTVVTAGLLGLAVLMPTSVAWTPDMPYLPIGLWFFAGALNLGWIMGPATESVMPSVPEEKSGVGSAMNDITRQVGGALGTAIISSVYASRVADSAAGLPDAARAAAEDSIGQANAIAATLPVSESAARGRRRRRVDRRARCRVTVAAGSRWSPRSPPGAGFRRRTGRGRPAWSRCRRTRRHTRVAERNKQAAISSAGPGTSRRNNKAETRVSRGRVGRLDCPACRLRHRKPPGEP